MSVFTKVLKAGEGKKVRRLAELVPLVGALEPEMQGLSDEALAHKTVEFKDRLDRGETLDDLLIEADDLERIFDRLGQLDEREATVVRMRFGLDPHSPMTLREVGENLGLTRERVRQLENQAILKLVIALKEDDSRDGN